MVCLQISYGAFKNKRGLWSRISTTGGDKKGKQKSRLSQRLTKINISLFNFYYTLSHFSFLFHFLSHFFFLSLFLFHCKIPLADAAEIFVDRQTACAVHLLSRPECHRAAFSCLFRLCQIFAGSHGGTGAVCHSRGQLPDRFMAAVSGSIQPRRLGAAVFPGQNVALLV